MDELQSYNCLYRSNSLITRHLAKNDRYNACNDKDACPTIFSAKTRNHVKYAKVRKKNVGLPTYL